MPERDQGHEPSPWADAAEMREPEPDWAKEIRARRKAEAERLRRVFDGFDGQPSQEAACPGSRSRPPGERDEPRLPAGPEPVAPRRPSRPRVRGSSTRTGSATWTGPAARSSSDVGHGDRALIEAATAQLARPRSTCTARCSRPRRSRPTRTRSRRTCRWTTRASIRSRAAARRSRPRSRWRARTTWPVGRTSAPTVIARRSSYHGNTLGALDAEREGAASASRTRRGSAGSCTRRRRTSTGAATRSIPRDAARGTPSSSNG